MRAGRRYLSGKVARSPDRKAIRNAHARADRQQWLVEIPAFRTWRNAGIPASRRYRAEQPRIYPSCVPAFLARHGRCFCIYP